MAEEEIKKNNQYPKSLNIFITEDCNLQCRYCFLDKTYKKSQLTFSDLKRAIDLLFSFPSKIKTIAFNGGEPLLEYPLLKETCLYIREKAEKEAVKVNLATMTNGTLLSREHCQFFEKNQIIVKISIDGDKKTHDTNRLFRDSSRKSSYLAIVNNLKNFNNKSKIAASLVFTPQNVINLFKNIKSLEKLGFGFIEFYPDMYAFWSKEQLTEFRKQFKQIIKYYISFFSKKKLKSIFKNSLLDSILNQREIVGLEGSRCQKIHLAPDGNFYFCDKVFSLPLSKRKQYITGSIKKGIDNNKRLMLLHFFQKKCQKVIGQQNDCCFCPIGHYLYFSSQNQNLKERFSDFFAVNKIYLDNFLLIKKKLTLNPLFAKLYQ